MEWLLAVECGMILFGFLSEAQPTIYVRNPVRVALAGETLQLRFAVTVPKNQSSDEFVCCHRISKRVLYRVEISETKHIPWNLTVFNSSDSGEYYCEYKNTRAYWFVRVRDVGYREPISRNDHSLLILPVVLSLGLLLFSSIGSILLFKDYRKQRKLRNDRKKEGDEEGDRDEEEEGDRDDEEDVDEEEAGDRDEEGDRVNEGGDEVPANSVYTALQHGTSSIYNVLDPSAKDSDQKCVPQQMKNKPRMAQNSQNQDGIFESVYENF